MICKFHMDFNISPHNKECIVSIHKKATGFQLREKSCHNIFKLLTLLIPYFIITMKIKLSENFKLISDELSIQNSIFTLVGKEKRKQIFHTKHY